MGRDPGAIGKTVRLNGDTFTIVGVMPASFWMPSRSNGMWLPLTPPVTTPEVRSAREGLVLAHLRPGSTLEQANQELAAVSAQTREALSAGEFRVGRPRLGAASGGDGRQRSGLAGCLIWSSRRACCWWPVPMSPNLLLAQAAARRREMAIRTAVGASRWHLIRQSLIESLLLSSMAGVLGLLVGFWAKDFFHRGLSVGHSHLKPRHRSVRAGLLFADFGAGGVILRLGAGLGFFSNGSDRRIERGAPQRSAHPSAGECVRIFADRAIYDSPGRDPACCSKTCGTCAAWISDSARTAWWWSNWIRRRRGMRAMNSFGRSIARRWIAWPVWPECAPSRLPVTCLYLRKASQCTSPCPENSPRPRSARWRCRWWFAPRYFESRGHTLRRGREFTNRDTASTARVAVVNQAFADRFWKGTDPIGKQLRLTDADARGDSWTIVGVAANVKPPSLQGPAHPQIYVPFDQAPQARDVLAGHHASDPSRILSGVRKAITDVDPD